MFHRVVHKCQYSRIEIGNIYFVNVVYMSCIIYTLNEFLPGHSQRDSSLIPRRILSRWRSHVEHVELRTRTHAYKFSRKPPSQARAIGARKCTSGDSGMLKSDVFQWEKIFTIRNARWIGASASKSRSGFKIKIAGPWHSHLLDALYIRDESPSSWDPRES